METRKIINNYIQFITLLKDRLNNNNNNNYIPPQLGDYDLYNDIMKDELKRKQIYDSIYK